jgi:hypothetical protein
MELLPLLVGPALIDLHDFGRPLILRNDDAEIVELRVQSGGPHRTDDCGGDNRDIPLFHGNLPGAVPDGPLATTMA